MFGIFRRYRRLLSRDAAQSFNRMAAFLTNFCSNESIKFDRPDEPSADNPPSIAVDLEWLLSVCIPKVTATGILYSAGGAISTKSFGTTSGTVAEGDHTHTTEDITDLDLSDYALALHTHSASDIVDWDDATEDFLTADDLTDYITSSSLATTLEGYAVSGHTHDLRYSRLNHTHEITDFTATNCTATAQSPCFILSDSTNGIYHSNQNPSVATVRAICSAWTSNGNSFGTGTSNLTHSDITDWATATADFLTSSDLSGYVTSSDLSTELADYVTSSALATELADYVDAQTVSDLADIVDGILDDYLSASDLSTTLADYVTSSDLSTTLAEYATTNDIDGVVFSVDGHSPNANGAVSFGLTASKWVKTDSSGHLTTTNDKVVTIASNQTGQTTNVTLVTGVTWNGTQLVVARTQLNFSGGVLTGTTSQTNTTIGTVAYSP